MSINVALIGKGYWGSKLEEYIKKNPHFRLAAVCDEKSDLYKEIYGNNKIEAVFVATPDKTHYSIVKNILIGKKHVMCEKPLALSEKECVELEALASKQNVFLCVDYTHTFSDSLNLAQKLVKKGALGKIKSIEMRMKQLGPFGRGSVYWLSASHMLAVLDMFAPLKEIKFYRKDLLIHKGAAETGIICFDDKNLNGEIFVSLNCPDKERCVTIYGDKGIIVYNPLISEPLKLVIYNRVFNSMQQPKHTVKNFKLDELHNLKNTVEYFYNAIKRKRESNIKRAVLVSKILENL